MIQRVLCCLLLLVLISCESAPIEPVQAQYGPTKMAKSPLGYRLTNRGLKAEINQVTGSTSLVKLTDAEAAEALTPSFSPMAESSPTAGYVESRDEETWQYIGQNKDGRLGWRIVYNLYYDGLNVTYIVQNNTNLPLTGHVQLPAAGRVQIQPFNESAELNSHNADGSVRSDERTLQPNERLNFATRWTLKSN